MPPPSKHARRLAAPPHSPAAPLSTHSPRGALPVSLCLLTPHLPPSADSTRHQTPSSAKVRSSSRAAARGTHSPRVLFVWPLHVQGTRRPGLHFIPCPWRLLFGFSNFSSQRKRTSQMTLLPRTIMSELNYLLISAVRQQGVRRTQNRGAESPLERSLGSAEGTDYKQVMACRVRGHGVHGTTSRMRGEGRKASDIWQMSGKPKKAF